METRSMTKPNALTSLHNGSLTGKRQQSIFTPTAMCRAIDETFMHFALKFRDPCPHVEAPMTQMYNCVATPVELNFDALDGKGPSPWGNAYINPPYDDLQEWIEVERRQWVEHGGHHINLVPVRTHRTWLVNWMDTLDEVEYLPPLKFEGYKQAFPAPLMLGYRGPDGSNSQFWKILLDNLREAGYLHSSPKKPRKKKVLPNA